MLGHRQGRNKALVVLMPVIKPSAQAWWTQVWVRCDCMFVSHMHSWCLWRSREVDRSRRTGVTGGSVQPCVCWGTRPSESSQPANHPSSPKAGTLSWHSKAWAKPKQENTVTWHKDSTLWATHIQCENLRIPEAFYPHQS